jgi:HD-GYP domain-containing protein (c-di-GMP phosphodiesterase class II)
MDKTIPSQDEEEVEELEPIDQDEPEGASDEAPASEPLLAEPGARFLARSFERTPEPMALLDRDLRFVFRNERFKALQGDFDYPESPSFLTSMARTMGGPLGRSIREALGDAGSGNAWKGTVMHRAKASGSRITKAHIQPIFLGESNGAPDAYWVYLDDVTEENKKYLRDMFSSLLEASKLKDNDTGKHIERVNLYAKILAEGLYNDRRYPEVDKDFIEDIGFLAAMHDVGKIGTPDDILNKKGPLNEFEWGIMKEHTKNGAFILSSYPNPLAKEIALSHHEWWNGSGYPYNLEGRMIPLAARIVTIADVYDALRMKRSYKPAYGHDIAIQKMRQERDVHFDPELVDVLVRVQDAFADIYQANAD